jgi:hypothetical protein
LTVLLPAVNFSQGDIPLTTSLPRIFRMKMALYGVFTGIFFISRFYYGSVTRRSQEDPWLISAFYRCMRRGI